MRSITLRFRNPIITIEGDVTTVTGDLINEHELMQQIVEGLVSDPDVLGDLTNKVGSKLDSELYEAMTEEEITAVWSRFLPPENEAL